MSNKEDLMQDIEFLELELNELLEELHGSNNDDIRDEAMSIESELEDLYAKLKELE